MQKFLKVLEQNVQWIALGLGGIFLVWMVWAYLLNEPAAIKVGTKELHPENIDEEIYNDNGKKLTQVMNHTDPVEMPISDVLTPYLARLDEKDAKTPTLASSFGGTRGGGEYGGGPGVGDVLPQKTVAKLPQLPRPTFVNSSTDITTILSNNVNAAAGNVQQVANTKDTDWVSLRYKVNMAEVAKAFGDAFTGIEMQQLLYTTRFLQVELIRQEKLPNGQWSEPPTTLPSQSLEQPYPGDEPPPDMAGKQAAAQYKNAAGNEPKLVLTPPFPKVAEGAPAWYAPGQNGPDHKAAGGPGAAGGAPKPAAAPPRPAQPGLFNPNAGGNVPPQQLAPGDINLLAANEDKEFIVHDLSVQDGKTYRYAIRYKLSNPVFDINNLAPPKLASQFALVSPQSEWTKEITVKPFSRLFVTNVNGTSFKVTFKLFEFKSGKYEQKQLDGTPGDSVSDWTVVDVRRAKDSYALILEGNGELKKHTQKTDQDDYDAFKQQVALQGAAAPAQAAMAK
jgi:hypothetical protein